jgi:GNAT superfamily N-acetyltransferase
MSGYRLLAHADVDDPQRFHQDLCRLNSLTFGEYHGVLLPTVESMRWYRTRPGMEAKVCQAALLGDEVVSSLFVTLAPMSLRGSMLLCGFLDTVMTHPAHRRRGLAGSLLKRALEEMRAVGADLALLYAAHDVPPTLPQKIYEGMGFRVHELVDRLVGHPPPAPESGPAVPVSPDARARQAFATVLSGRDGWIELDDALWDWRRVRRPSQYPTRLYESADGGLCAMCSGDLMSGGRPRTVSVLSDLVLPETPDVNGTLASILSAAPSDVPITVLCPRSDVRVRQILDQLGFTHAAVEAAMIKPLTRRAVDVARASPRTWYVAVESVIGV